MRDCWRCGRAVESRFRFCPWCAAPQRRKLTELFAARDGQAVRVSRYLVSDEGKAHVRVSVWSADGEALAAASLEEDEAARLAAFVADRPAREDSGGEGRAQISRRGRLRRLTHIGLS